MIITSQSPAHQFIGGFPDIVKLDKMKHIHRPFIIPIFIPYAGCPHRCIFCNQHVSSGVNEENWTPETIRFEIGRYLSLSSGKRSFCQIAFYGGNFLGLSDHNIQTLLSIANDYVQSGQVDSIRFSTRPDTITHEKLEILKPFPVQTIELGVQSMDDDVLSKANRGHTALDTINAIERLKFHQYQIGVQLMVGLPDDTEDRTMMSTKKIADLTPDFVRIFPTIVLKDTSLANQYLSGLYSPLSLDTAVTLVKKMYLYFKNHHIPVIRMGLQASDGLDTAQSVLAGPYHPSFGHLVYSEIFLDLARKQIIDQLNTKATFKHRGIQLLVNPQQISVMRGIKNKNIEQIKLEFGIHAIQVIPDPNISHDKILLFVQ